MKNNSISLCIVCCAGSFYPAMSYAGDALFLPLPGFSQAFGESSARAISADGSVVVGGAVSLLGYDLPVIWRDGVLVEIPLTGGYTAGFATDVSGDGSLVVGQLNQDGNIYNGRVFSSLNGTTTVYTALMPNTRTSLANGVSRDGRVIVGWSNGISTEFNGLRIENGFQSELLDLPGGVADDAACNAVNFDGSVVGGRGVSSAAGSSRYEACLWAPGPLPIAMGDLPGGRFLSEIQAMNADGTIFVGYANTPAVPSGEFGEATIWINNAPPQSLGDLPGGIYSSYAYSVSDDGGVVVGYGTTDRGHEAFVWTPTTGMEPLEDAIHSRWGLSLPIGWKLTHGLDLSADGTVIVGRGINPDGIVQGWSVTVPCWNSESVVSLSDDIQAPANAEATFMVESFGSGNPSYQWRLSNGDGVWTDLIDGPEPDLGFVIGATSSTLAITDLVASMTWLVRVEVSNPCGSAISESRRLVVGELCLPDLSEPFGILNFFDISAFLTAYQNHDPIADFNNDGSFNFFDVSAFLTAYNAGCP